MGRLLLSMLAGALGVASLAATGCAADPAGDEAAVDARSSLGSDAYRIYADVATEGGAAPTPGT